MALHGLPAWLPNASLHFQGLRRPLTDLETPLLPDPMPDQAPGEINPSEGMVMEYSEGTGAYSWLLTSFSHCVPGTPSLQLSQPGLFSDNSHPVRKV